MVQTAVRETHEEIGVLVDVSKLERLFADAIPGRLRGCTAPPCHPRNTCTPRASTTPETWLTHRAHWAAHPSWPVWSGRIDQTESNTKTKCRFYSGRCTSLYITLLHCVRLDLRLVLRIVVNAQTVAVLEGATYSGSRIAATVATNSLCSVYPTAQPFLSITQYNYAPCETLPVLKSFEPFVQFPRRTPLRWRPSEDGTWS